MAAKQSVMHELHEALAAMFLEDIKICRVEGIPMSSSDKMAISKFLKDNAITADLDSNEMEQLKAEFKDELAARREKKATEILASEDDEDGYANIL
jgi:hypothetical protein